MSSDLVLASAAERINAAFDLAEVEDALPEARMEHLRRQLIERIVELLNRNPEKLMSILYRIDVSEPRVNDIMKKSFPTEVPLHLADLIIERQIAKARSRAEHRDSSS
jgi:predicted XRE-type DNA-binding protein